MTTKDQAIASYITQQEAVGLAYSAGVWTDGKKLHLPQEHFGSICNHAIKWYAAQPPAPDCRTCHYYTSLEGCFNTMHNELRGVVCTNGDQYKQAPSVVLWRTE